MTGNATAPGGSVPVADHGMRRLPFSAAPAGIEAWRLFFPTALLFAPANVLLWLAVREGLIAPPGAVSAVWHGSEMVFGYGFAVIAGYLLRPLPPGRLCALWVLWLAGRLLVLLPVEVLPGPAVFVVAVAFPLLIAGLGVRRFGSIKRARNLPFPLIMLVLGLCAAVAFAVQSGLLPHPLRSPAVLAASVVALLIMIMGGRLVPTATIGALRARGLIVRIVVRPAVELALCVLVLGWVASDAFLGPPPAGVFALAAGVTLMVAMSGWHPVRVLHDPLVWPLHLGFVWLAAGCVLGGSERLGFLVIPDAGALHALTAGGIGTVTLAMILRVTRYRAGAFERSTFLLHALQVVMAMAVLLRVCGGWAVPSLGGPLLWWSALAWAAAYLLAACLDVPAAWREKEAR